MMVTLLIIWLLAAPVLGSKTLDIHNGVIVHLFEWKYSDIARECEEFLGPFGYQGIQISPPNENLVLPGRPWYERYQPVSYKLTTRSGTEEELADMVRRCNRVGVRVFADVVINHMTGSTDSCHGTANSSCNARSMSYPSVPYSSNDFHHPTCSINDIDNKHEARFCELLGLHDLDQSKEYVRHQISDFLNHLIELGVAGFRVDAARHMFPTDLAAIYSQLRNLNTNFLPPNTKPFIFQEVSSSVEGAKEYTSMGLVTDFQYGRELGRCFKGQNSLKWLHNFGSAWNLIPGDQSVVFIENHDVERSSLPEVLNYKNAQAYKMAIAFMLAWPHGTPKVLSSYKFSSDEEGPPHDSRDHIIGPHPINDHVCSNGWICQHRWRQIYNMVAFHNVVQGTEIKSWWDNGRNQIAFCRGSKGFIAFNLENYPLNQTLQTCLPKGSYCDIITSNIHQGRCTGKSVLVERDGTARINIGRFDPQSLEDGILALQINQRI